VERMERQGRRRSGYGEMNDGLRFIRPVGTD
jgi:hypothetical protein